MLQTWTALGDLARKHPRSHIADLYVFCCLFFLFMFTGHAKTLLYITVMPNYGNYISIFNIQLHDIPGQSEMLFNSL